MDVDKEAGEGHSGVKRKVGEDTEPASKKLRMGMFLTIFCGSVANITIFRRTCGCPFEEVSPINAPFMFGL